MIIICSERPTIKYPLCLSRTLRQVTVTVHIVERKGGAANAWTQVRLLIRSIAIFLVSVENYSWFACADSFQWVRVEGVFGGYIPVSLSKQQMRRPSCLTLLMEPFVAGQSPLLQYYPRPYTTQSTLRKLEGYIVHDIRLLSKIIAGIAIQYTRSNHTIVLIWLQFPFTRKKPRKNT